MRLTNKCKKDFEKWFLNMYGSDFHQVSHFSILLKQYEMKEFYLFPNSMKYGVYVDFFLEVVKKDIDKSISYYTETRGKKKARDIIIYKANIRYNEANK
ncbi:MAG: hypothetical protein GY928_02120 [Colwellia sp.]|nr:hypothetical protein [Colwellia sp.]